MRRLSMHQLHLPDYFIMVWYGMVNVDLYTAIITKVSNALNTLVGYLEKSQVFRPCLKDSQSCFARRSSGKEFQTIIMSPSIL